jgi:hypothetical protein
MSVKKLGSSILGRAALNSKRLCWLEFNQANASELKGM